MNDEPLSLYRGLMRGLHRSGAGPATTTAPASVQHLPPNALPLPLHILRLLLCLPRHSRRRRLDRAPHHLLRDFPSSLPTPLPHHALAEDPRARLRL